MFWSTETGRVCVLKHSKMPQNSVDALSAFPRCIPIVLGSIGAAKAEQSPGGRSCSRKFLFPSLPSQRISDLRFWIFIQPELSHLEWSLWVPSSPGYSEELVHSGSNNFLVKFMENLLNVLVLFFIFYTLLISHQGIMEFWIVLGWEGP